MWRGTARWNITKLTVGPTVWGHITYFNVVTDGICRHHFSLKSKIKNKQRKIRRMRLHKCNFPSGVAGTWYTCNARTMYGFSQSMAAYAVIVHRDISLTRYKHIQWLIIYLCVHLARPTCIHCITLQRTWNQAVFCTWVLWFVTWWLGGAGAQAIVTWLRIGTGWTTCTGQSRTTNG